MRHYTIAVLTAWVLGGCGGRSLPPNADDRTTKAGKIPSYVSKIESKQKMDLGDLTAKGEVGEAEEEVVASPVPVANKAPEPVFIAQSEVQIPKTLEKVLLYSVIPRPMYDWYKWEIYGTKITSPDSSDPTFIVKVPLAGFIAGRPHVLRFKKNTTHCTNVSLTAGIVHRYLGKYEPGKNGGFFNVAQEFACQASSAGTCVGKLFFFPISGDASFVIPPSFNSAVHHHQAGGGDYSNYDLIIDWKASSGGTCPSDGMRSSYSGNTILEPIL